VSIQNSDPRLIFNIHFSLAQDAIFDPMAPIDFGSIDLDQITGYDGDNSKSKGTNAFWCISVNLLFPLSALCSFS
jgi:hypothetical protein